MTLDAKNLEEIEINYLLNYIEHKLNLQRDTIIQNV
jgi:hypothetical protein